MPKVQGSAVVVDLSRSMSLSSKAVFDTISPLIFGCRDVYARPSIELCCSAGLLAFNVRLTRRDDKSSACVTEDSSESGFGLQVVSIAIRLGVCWNHSRYLCKHQRSHTCSFSL